MPITYEFDPRSSILRSYHSGRQTVSGICEYFQQVIDDPTVKKGYIEVVHFADDVDFDFTSHTARIIPFYFSELKNRKNTKVTIFIGATQLQFGIARMMKNLHELSNPGDDVRVVRTPEEAQREINSIRSAQDDFPVIACS
jgi:hypothetical protein